MGTQVYSEKCNPKNCIYCEIGFLGTKFCDWKSDVCPEDGCYKEEAERREQDGDVEYFFTL